MDCVFEIELSFVEHITYCFSTVNCYQKQNGVLFCSVISKNEMPEKPAAQINAKLIS